MTIIRSIALLFLAVLTIGGCTTPRTAPDKGAASGLYRTWMESHEERAGETEIYRDTTFRFPSARGREGFTIGSTGQFTWHRIAPQDGTMDVAARWRFENGSATVLIITDPATGRDTERLTIISLEPALLKLTRTTL